MSLTSRRKLLDLTFLHGLLRNRINCPQLLSRVEITVPNRLPRSNVYKHVFLVRAGVNYSWHIEWAVKLDDLLGVPAIQGDKLVLQIKQDELVNYYSTDEKIIEVQDPEVLTWIQARVECALILAMEDKRCPTQF
ncbi:unnamed protein product [Plutella xylostella]|uniref:(diamondback moth) hypothetical protein n=1 Tax=Plutella xylostella TaxID=51655 RepID=A0A8S4FWU0_PLUXY|nr:unnamed protein product [Plutella xylostella]